MGRHTNRPWLLGVCQNGVWVLQEEGKVRLLPDSGPMLGLTYLAKCLCGVFGPTAVEIFPGKTALRVFSGKMPLLGPLCGPLFHEIPLAVGIFGVRL